MLCIGAGQHTGLQCRVLAPGCRGHLPHRCRLQLRRRCSWPARAAPRPRLLPPALRSYKPACRHAAQVHFRVCHGAPAAQQLPGGGGKQQSLLYGGYRGRAGLLGAGPFLLRSAGLQPGAGRHHPGVCWPCGSGGDGHCHKSRCSHGAHGILDPAPQTLSPTGGRWACFMLPTLRRAMHAVVATAGRLPMWQHTCCRLTTLRAAGLTCRSASASRGGHAQQVGPAGDQRWWRLGDGKPSKACPPLAGSSACRCHLQCCCNMRAALSSRLGSSHRPARPTAPMGWSIGAGINPWPPTCCGEVLLLLVPMWQYSALSSSIAPLQVCDKSFTDREATTICRQLGLRPPGVAIGGALYGQGTGKVSFYHSRRVSATGWATPAGLAPLAGCSVNSCIATAICTPSSCIASAICALQAAALLLQFARSKQLHCHCHLHTPNSCSQLAHVPWLADLAGRHLLLQF